MKPLFMLAEHFDRQVHRFRTALNVVGWVCFALITANYARFIDLPALITIPLWLGVLLNVFRWAIWEGMLRPKFQTSAEQQARVESGVAEQPKGD